MDPLQVSQTLLRTSLMLLYVYRDHEVLLGTGRPQSPREIKNREVELGSPNWMDCLAAELFLNSCLPDSVFVTFFCTSVQRAVSRVHKFLRTGGVPTSLS